MGHYEDFWYDITNSLNEKGLREKFDKQLKKMGTQIKHRYKDTREKWSYAHDKIIKKHNNKK
jgi:hypothetical protein